MKIIVTRDSVCAADDFDPPHEKSFRFSDEKPMKAVLQELLSVYLPKIAGGKATWVAQTDAPLAVVAQEWEEPEMIKEVATVSDVFPAGTSPRLYFEYLAQEAPSTVLQKLKKI
ncbi:MAG TPA: hypothetical protein VI298_10040 [Geobacteraceae bacterium]